MNEKVIYKIANRINDKIYIGSTSDKRMRWQKHKSRLKNNKHNNPHLQNAWNKYGNENFEFSVIEQVNKTNDLIQREQHYIDNLEPEYNIIPKADRSEASEKTRKKISEAVSGKNNPFYGRRHSEETREKISEANSGKDAPFYGKHHSKEVRQRISEAHQGRECTEEHKKKISESLKGHKPSEKTKEKLSEVKKGEKNPSSKLTRKTVKVVLHLLEGGHFTHKEIGKMYGVSTSTIGMIAEGKTWRHVSI